MITFGKCFCAVALIAAAGCAKSDKPPLTREAFAAALTKCRPLSASFTNNADGPPSVAITIPNASSAVPDCMVKAFDGFAIKELQISYSRSGEGVAN